MIAPGALFKEGRWIAVPIYTKEIFATPFWTWS